MKRLKPFIVSILLIFSLPTIPVIAASTIYIDNEQCYAVKNDDSLWTWEYGNSDVCEKILDNVESVCCNYAIKTDGSLWAWGKNLFGEFETPTVVMEDVRDIEANSLFAFIVKNDNSLWAVGSNSCNNMGLIDYHIKTSIPIKVMNNVKKAVLGESHGIILKTDGSIITTGLNKEGQLGIGKSDIVNYRANINVAEAYDIYAGRSSSYVKSNNMLWMWGTTYEFDETGGIYTQYAPKKYLENVKQIVSRFGYDIILKNDGSVWFYGAERLEKEGCIETDAGVIYLQLPYYIMDNVCWMSEGRSDFLNKVLLLANDGVLYECSLESESKFIGDVEIKTSMVNDIKTPKYTIGIEMNDYNDIEDSVSKNEIKALTRAGILKGVTADQFMPDKPITRAETATILLRMTGKENDSGEVDFLDVTPDKWYYDTVGASQKYGIINGFDDNTFRGDETVSELQLVCLASRALRNEGTAQETDKIYEVSASIPEWAKSDVEYAVINGIITEDEAKTLSEKEMTRGESVVILYRLYHVI